MVKIIKSGGGSLGNNNSDLTVTRVDIDELLEEQNKAFENVRISITVPKALREEAKKRADTLGMSMSALVRTLMYEYLEK